MQRFRDGFSAIPPMRALGELWDRDIAGAAREAARIGRTIAGELRAHGVDFSFTPVLDLDHGESTVIGDRALHRNPNAVAHLAVGAPRRDCVRAEWPLWASIFRDMAMWRPIRTRSCRSTIDRLPQSLPTISFRSARWCTTGSRRSCPRT